MQRRRDLLSGIKVTHMAAKRAGCRPWRRITRAHQEACSSMAAAWCPVRLLPSSMPAFERGTVHHDRCQLSSSTVAYWFAENGKIDRLPCPLSSKLLTRRWRCTRGWVSRRRRSWWCVVPLPWWGVWLISCPLRGIIVPRRQRWCHYHHTTPPTLLQSNLVAVSDHALHIGVVIATLSLLTI